MSISVNQQMPKNLEKLKAFIVQYRIAKRTRLPRIIIAYVLALTSPFIIRQYPSFKNPIAITGASFVIIAFVCSHYEKKGIKLGAQLQDEFDTSVFQLDWNQFLVGDHPSAETIHNLSRMYKGKVDERWYGNLDNIHPPFDVLICQRSNAVWDWRLRNNWFITGTLSLIILFVLGVILAASQRLMLIDYIKGVLLPSSAAFVMGFRELYEHFDNINAKKSVERKINSLLEKAISAKEIPTVVMLRQIQDVIYILRKCTAIIPDWYSCIFKKKYDNRMQVVIDNYKEKLKHVFG
jgi:predicted pore-forming effector associated with SMODS systems